MIATEAIFADADGNLVARDDPKVAVQLVGKGAEIPQDVEDKLLAHKLTEKPGKKALPPDVPKERQKRIVRPELKRK